MSYTWSWGFWCKALVNKKSCFSLVTCLIFYHYILCERILKNYLPQGCPCFRNGLFCFAHLCTIIHLSKYWMPIIVTWLKMSKTKQPIICLLQIKLCYHQCNVALPLAVSNIATANQSNLRRQNMFCSELNIAQLSIMSSCEAHFLCRDCKKLAQITFAGCEIWLYAKGVWTRNCALKTDAFQVCIIPCIF